MLEKGKYYVYRLEDCKYCNNVVGKDSGDICEGCGGVLRPYDLEAAIIDILTKHPTMAHEVLKSL